MAELNRYVKFLVISIVIFSLSSCGFIFNKPTANSSLTLESDDTAVALDGAGDDYELSNDDPVYSFSSSFRAGATEVASGYYLKLIGSLDSPEVEGTTLRATHIAVEDDYAFITYMIEGDEYGGGIDVIDISDPSSPSRVTGKVFQDMDIACVAVSGSSVFLGGSVDDDIPAVIDKYSFSDNSLSFEKRAKMPSYYVTSLTVSGSYLVAAAGNDDEGGIFVLTTDMDNVAEERLEGIRYVDTDGSYVYALQEDTGSGANLLIRSLDSSLSAVSVTSVDGMTIAEAKSTLYVSGSLVYTALSDGGYAVYDVSNPASPSLLDSFDQPDFENEDIPLSDTTVNAVSLHETDDFGTFMFLANGEAGTYIAAVNNSTSFEREVIGRYLFDDNESANYVGGSGNIIFTATGIGGLKIVEIAEFTGDLYDTGDFFHDITDPYHDSDGLPVSNDFYPYDSSETEANNLTGTLGAFGTQIYNAAETLNSAAGDLLQPSKKKNSVPDLYPELFDGTKKNTLEIKDGYDISGNNLKIYATFLSETAGYKNTFGYYTFDDGNPPETVDDAYSNNWKIVFANASQSGGGGSLSTGDTVQINSQLLNQDNWGFFLMSNGWRGNKVLKGIYEMYSHNDLNDTNKGDDQQQAIMMYKVIDGKKYLFLGFEDIPLNKSDESFNDTWIMFSFDYDSGTQEDIINWEDYYNMDDL